MKKTLLVCVALLTWHLPFSEAVAISLPDHEIASDGTLVLPGLLTAPVPADNWVWSLGAEGETGDEVSLPYRQYFCRGPIERLTLRLSVIDLEPRPDLDAHLMAVDFFEGMGVALAAEGYEAISLEAGPAAEPVPGSWQMTATRQSAEETMVHEGRFLRSANLMLVFDVMRVAEMPATPFTEMLAGVLLADEATVTPITPAKPNDGMDVSYQIGRVAGLVVMILLVMWIARRAFAARRRPCM